MFLQNVQTVLNDKFTSSLTRNQLKEGWEYSRDLKLGSGLTLSWDTLDVLPSGTTSLA
jgi:hypothetical protein